MDLQTVRVKLERLEDTICSALLERMQYKLDSTIYEKGGIPIPGFDGSFFEFLFRQLETAYDSVGRYSHPEERPFFITPKQPVVQLVDDIGIKPVTNLTNKILSAYMANLPRLCGEGDDKQRGSPATADINVLQALSRRVHIGEQVAEVKYWEDKEGYDALVKAGDTAGITEKLRDRGVEKRVLARVGEKSERYQVPCGRVTKFFDEHLMPLTIEAEVGYFMSKAPALKL